MALRTLRVRVIRVRIPAARQKISNGARVREGWVRFPAARLD